MTLRKKPVTGMKDILPEEMEIRDYVMNVIKDTYKSFGFTSLETPAVESIENLNCKAGGENEKLIFKILKRGEKLKLEEAKSEEDLVDGGLRYDLTVPLVRYYAAHTGELPSPFKALQMGNVWRADRPQRGRYRQFMQCDIDILGEPTNLAEIELILATTQALGKLGFRDFQIRINDRRILKAMAAYSGFSEDSFDDVFMILDKMDKIGIGGVREELLGSGYENAVVEKYLALFEGLEEDAAEEAAAPREEQAVRRALQLLEKLQEILPEQVRTGFQEIIDSINALKGDEFTLLFDPTLVRGMSYYTGTIFEVAMPQYGGSCGGGGRYDQMVEKFTGQAVPACGFSIGFERIIMLLMENGFKVPGGSEKTAYLIEKGVSRKALVNVMRQAQKERESGKKVLLVRMNKNKKFQKEQLAAQGYTEFREFYREGLKF